MRRKFKSRKNPQIQKAQNEMVEINLETYGIKIQIIRLAVFIKR